jgi:L-aspartate oxidase
LSECFVFARRAIADALSESSPVPPGEEELETLRSLSPMPHAGARTRDALWRDAGIVRSEEGLRRLLGDPHPLARLIGRCALARTESRGAHQRSDYPDRDASLDSRHAVVAGEEPVCWKTWS